jgi:RHS repeat-associated protein
LVVFSPVAFAEGAPSLGGVGGSPLGSSLVVPGGLVEGQELKEAEEVSLHSPEAVVAREASQTKYEGLSVEESAKLAERVFPNVIDRPDGGLPQLPEGESVTGYPTDDAAQVELPGGKSGVLEALAPIAVDVSPGRRVPVDLSLTEAGGAFEPRTSVVGVRIPKQLQDGVSLAGTGISLTPVDGSGTRVGGSEGQVEGSVVFYGGVGAGSDMDMAVKPSALGFSMETFLRSERSPDALRFNVGLPEGANLVQVQGGVVEVVQEGAIIGVVLPPIARDAAGTPVPVSMGVSGHVLTLSVDVRQNEFQYPIVVDPTVVDSQLPILEGYYQSRWKAETSSGKVVPFEFNEGYGKIYDYHTETSPGYARGEWGGFAYEAQGDSTILRVSGVTVSGVGNGKNADIENRLQIKDKTAGGKHESEVDTWPEDLDAENQELCVKEDPGCLPLEPTSETESNSVSYIQFAKETSTLAFAEFIEKANVELYQTAKSTASLDTKDAEIEGHVNALYGTEHWVNAAKAVVKGSASDPGIGISKLESSSPNEAHWGIVESFLYPSHSGACQGVICAKEESHTYSLGGLPEGKDTVNFSAGNATNKPEELAKATGTVYVDNAAPHGITLSGLPSNHEINDGQHISLKASATDGTKPTPSSGIASILLEVDGQAISGPQGACSPGECTGTAEWTVSGENYAAGEHTLTVVATDNAGNVASEEYHVKIHDPEDVTVGPGSVNPVTGELTLTATDVSLSVPGGGLTVSRSYRSRHVAQGAEGPLGPQWSLSLGAQQSLSRVSGGMVLTASNSGQILFESKGKGEFSSPTGDAGLVLAEKAVEGKPVFTLSENGSVTTFELPAGSSGSVWMPSSDEGPNGTNTTLYKFKVESGVIEPIEELAPIPAGVSCGKEISELKEGCRALKFRYATETKAKGENASEWGEVAGHLAEVKYIAWNASKAKTETTVAEYAYDKKGRLRAEWDPRITPSLKTTYGYDIEGHVTAASAPGREPWLLEQGTIPSDASMGRLLAVSVPSAETAFGTGEAPVNKEIPTLSSTKPVVGTKISVNLTSEKTPGKWSGSPLAFIYQWEDCNSSGKECTLIPGAVNQAYYPVAGDEGHTLVGEAIALNATGAVSASSAVTSTVASGTPNTPLPEPPSVGSSAVWTLEYQVPVSGSGAPYEMSSTETAKWGQTDDPSEAMAIFPPDKVMGWPAKEYKRENVYYLDGKDRAVNTAIPTGGISTTEYNLYNDVVRTLSPNNRVTALKESCKSETECKSAEVAKLLDTESSYEEKGSEPGTELLSTLGPQHTVKLASGKGGKFNEEVLARERTTYSYNEGAPSGGPYHLVTKTKYTAETASKEEFDKRVTATSYSGQSNLGWKLRKPTSVTTEPGGLDLVHTIEYSSSTGEIVETATPAASGKDAKIPPTYAAQFGTKGSGAGQFNSPGGIAIDAHGNVWVADYANNRIDKYTASGTFIQASGFGVISNSENKFQICTTTCTAGLAGSGNGEFSGPVGITYYGGNLYVADYGNDRIEELNEKGEYAGKFGSKGKGVEQMEGPVSVAVNSSGNIAVSDLGNHRIDEFNSSGKFIQASGYGVISNSENRFQICTTTCVAGLEGSGEGEFAYLQGVAFSGSNLYVADYGNNRIEELNEKGEYVTTFGVKGTSKGEFEGPVEIAVNASGNLYITDLGNGRVQVLSGSGSYIDQFGVKGSGNGELTEPGGIAVNSSGDVYVGDSGDNRIEEWVPTITGNESAHDTKTIYYSKAVNSEYSTCGEHPELANLPCETRPAAQPGTSGLPELPVTKYTYNIWDEPETVTETVGSSTRTKTDTYDTAGRVETEGTSSTIGTALPTVTDKYNPENGILEKQSTTTEGKTKTITSSDNRLDQLISYTDAGENTSTYEYEKEKGARLIKVNNGKGTETYSYNETTGLPTEVLYENGTTKIGFTATRDVEGHILTEGYPNGMTATYTYNSVDEPTALEYKKTTHCTEEKEKCVWFKDTVIPSIHGQWLEQATTFSRQVFLYDAAGRLTKVQNTPTGKSCTAHVYGYDEDGDRTSVTTESKCAPEGATVEGHTYDTADRLTDPGIKYSEFGDITTLPAQNAEDPELTNTYYVDNQLASQKQSKQTIGYNLDPAGRTLETISTGEPNNSDITSHYAGPGDAPAWTENPISKEWQRNIPGINGTLAAIQSNGGTPELQLTNLHGDIIATASMSETATELTSKAETSEFGVPTISTPAKYSWLGAIELPTELSSGVIAMGARSYIPQLGRFLQPDPIPGGSANAYSYTYDDPVNTTDPTGTYTWGFSAGLIASLNATGQEIIQREDARETAEREAREAAEREAAARAAAERAAAEAAAYAEAAAGPQYSGGEEEIEESEIWLEEEGGYGGGSYGGGDGLHFITDKGGPGAFCGSNSTTHRKCHEPKGGTEKENIEACGMLGGGIGGVIGGAIGDLPGGFAGGIAGQKAAEKACKAV